MINMQGYKGTRDFLPKDWRLQQYIFNKWRETSELYGFEEYEAPVIEQLDLFIKKSGSEIKEQLFWFKDKGGRLACLRPELTPQLARYIVQYGKNLKKPLKWYSISRLFRYERPQKGRLREFFQYNADIISSTIQSTAEVINLCIDLLKSFGLKSKDFKIRVNDRRLVNELMEKFKLPKATRNNFMRTLDKRYKMSEKEFLGTTDSFTKEYRKELRKLFKLKGNDCLKYLKSIGVNTERLETLFTLVDKKYVEFDLSIVRGLVYYTGIVFEGFDDKIELRAILGGGEYENLVSDLGGPRIPCVGVGIGDVVLLELLKKKNLMPKFKKKGLFIATIGNVSKQANNMASELRKNKINVFLNTSKLNLSKQIALAQSKGYEKMMIIGPKELKEGKVVLKNLVSGAEKKVLKLRITSEIK